MSSTSFLGMCATHGETVAVGGSDATVERVEFEFEGERLDEEEEAEEDDSEEDDDVNEEVDDSRDDDDDDGDGDDEEEEEVVEDASGGADVDCEADVIGDVVSAFVESEAWAIEAARIILV